MCLVDYFSWRPPQVVSGPKAWWEQSQEMSRSFPSTNPWCRKSQIKAKIRNSCGAANSKQRPVVSPERSVLIPCGSLLDAKVTGRFWYFFPFLMEKAMSCQNKGVSIDLIAAKMQNLVQTLPGQLSPAFLSSQHTPISKHTNITSNAQHYHAAEFQIIFSHSH